MSTVRAGTVHYRAPEVLAHVRYRSPVDIWSLGVVGLEHLEELPNEDDSSTEADYALCISAYAESLAIYDPSHTHRHLLNQMLSEKPAERPTAVQCLEAVSDLIAQGTSPVTPSQIEPVTSGGQEHPHSDFNSQDTVRVGPMTDRPAGATDTAITAATKTRTTSGIMATTKRKTTSGTTATTAATDARMLLHRKRFAARAAFCRCQQHQTKTTASEPGPQPRPLQRCHRSRRRENATPTAQHQGQARLAQTGMPPSGRPPPKGRLSSRKRCQATARSPGCCLYLKGD